MMMQPGRDLDALVAEKVMGFKRAFESQDHPGQWYFEKDGFSVKPHEIPEYSTSIEAAWLVVEKMRERSLDVALETSSLGGANAVFGRSGYLGDDLSGPGVESGDSAPHAICLAALKAVGVSVE